MKLVIASILSLMLSCQSTRVHPRDVAREAQRVETLRDSVESLKSQRDECERLRNEIVVLKSRKVEAANLVKVEAGYLPRLMIFTAPEWCVPCVKMQAEIDRLGKMTYKDKDGKDQLWGGLIGSGSDNAIQVVDISDDDGPESKLAVTYNAGKTVPTIVRIDANGKQESRWVGTMTAEMLAMYQSGKWRPPRKLDEIVGK